MGGSCKIDLPAARGRCRPGLRRRRRGLRRRRGVSSCSWRRRSRWRGERWRGGAGDTAAMAAFRRTACYQPLRWQLRSFFGPQRHDSITFSPWAELGRSCFSSRQQPMNNRRARIRRSETRDVNSTNIFLIIFKFDPVWKILCSSIFDFGYLISITDSYLNTKKLYFYDINIHYNLIR